MNAIPFWTAGGRTIDLLAIRPEDVTADILGDALAKLNRFSGRTGEPSSVATHSVLVERLCSPELGPWALLHDAHEIFLGDITTPAVDLIAESGRIPDLHDAIATAKGRIDRAIGAAWGVPLRSVNQEVRRADHIALQAEALVYLDITPVLFDPRDDEDIDRAVSHIIEMPPPGDWRVARDLWLARVEHYSRLGGMTPPRAVEQARMVQA